MVRCGHCKELHDNVADVRRCSTTGVTPSPLAQIADHGRSQIAPYDAAQKQREAAKRRSRPTRSESLLNKALKAIETPYRFKREFELHGYVVDFYCSAARLIVEVDGKVHESQVTRDTRRDEVLKANGYRVIRFTTETVVKDPKAAALVAIRAADTPAARKRLQRRKRTKQSRPTALDKKVSKVRKSIAEEARVMDTLAIMRHNRKVLAARQAKELKCRFACAGCKRSFWAAASPRPSCNRCRTADYVTAKCASCARDLSETELHTCTGCREASSVARSHNDSAGWLRNGKHSGGS